ncbi:TlpA disulfide reductase family protein [Lewinella sp. W8]|uniref:TlpA family protein disulfide reductase n=1 Tax=Lewinella sp. W8 TaxID=2528208 RepID=UPI0010685C79|nr:TlpA disulfide reductase family protein [Lewinella sp. W8]MTB51544.1 redoxin domain-containing protein [Lewinella sp. W8]
MKKWIASPLIVLFLSVGLSAQDVFPTPELLDVKRAPASLATYVNNGKPTVVAIWATWCFPCHKELDEMKPYLGKWEMEYGADFVAVSVDQPRYFRQIQPLVKRKGWAYNVLVDQRGQLQQQLGFSSIPQLYVLDQNGAIIKSFSGYQEGREKQVDRLLQRLSSKK